MLSNISSWFNSTNFSSDHEVWAEWQKKQPMIHFEKSVIFEYYKSLRPKFEPFKDAACNDVLADYYRYCFGDFTQIISIPYSKQSNLIRYVELLLDVYDTCKGVSRKFAGDPDGIVLLRKVYKTKDFDHLYNHDFHQYRYDYTKLHAHTVAQYSLSTLIMRIADNLMHYHFTTAKFKNISVSLCKDIFDSKIFGENSKHKQSVPIEIKKPDAPIIDDNKSSSLPINMNKLCKCKSCGRICDKLHGCFSSCLDCYLSKICSICGMGCDEDFVNGFSNINPYDTLPKCMFHMNSSK